ncbi:MAG TPA: hypothetical protein VMT76_06995 [Puia sp.]|nr:hypothetical protein [Puia sp.]
MSSPAALYYPHTNITDKNIIKNALLLWDQVEYITPERRWEHQKFQSKAFNEAIEIVARPHYPTMDERDAVHDRVVKMLKDGVPDWFFLNTLKTIRNPQTYPIYTSKLDYRTWRLLQENLLAQFNPRDSDYHLTPYAGLVLMSLLADACAGTSKRKITDRSEAYSWLQQHATEQLGGQYVTGLDISQVAPAYDRLVTLSIKVVNTDDIPISTLVQMRKREAKSNSSDYRNFRRNYLGKVDGFVAQITKPGMTATDIIEIERQFKTDMESDLKDIKAELGLEKKKILLSKEVAVAASAVGGAFSVPVHGLTDITSALGAIGVGALYRAIKVSQADRKKVLKSHSMSWLYLAEKRASAFNPLKVIF